MPRHNRNYSEAFGQRVKEAKKTLASIREDAGEKLKKKTGEAKEKLKSMREKFTSNNKDPEIDDHPVLFTKMGTESIGIKVVIAFVILSVFLSSILLAYYYWGTEIDNKVVEYSTLGLVVTMFFTYLMLIIRAIISKVDRDKRKEAEGEEEGEEEVPPAYGDEPPEYEKLRMNSSKVDTDSDTEFEDVDEIEKKIKETTGVGKNKMLNIIESKLSFPALFSFLGIVVFTLTLIQIDHTNGIFPPDKQYLQKEVTASIGIGIGVILLWVLLMSLYIGGKENKLTKFVIFLTLSCLLYSTILISAYRFDDIVESKLTNDIASGLLGVLYLTFILLSIFIAYPQAFSKNTKHHGLRNDFQVFLLFFILFVYLYLGGTVLYVNSKMNTNKYTLKWIIASGVIFIVSLLAIVIYIGVKLKNPAM